MATVNTSVKLDEDTKKEAQELFKNLGLNLSTAINIFLKQAVREQGIPFQVAMQPNKELLEAFDEAEKIKKNPEKYKSYATAQEMMKDILGEGY